MCTVCSYMLNVKSYIHIRTSMHDIFINQSSSCCILSDSIHNTIFYCVFILYKLFHNGRIWMRTCLSVTCFKSVTRKKKTHAIYLWKRKNLSWQKANHLSGFLSRKSPPQSLNNRFINDRNIFPSFDSGITASLAQTSFPDSGSMAWLLDTN